MLISISGITVMQLKVLYLPLSINDIMVVRFVSVDTVNRNYRDPPRASWSFSLYRDVFDGVKIIFDRSSGN